MNEREPRTIGTNPEASPAPKIDFESLPPFEKRVVEFTEKYGHVNREQALLTPDLRKLMNMAKEEGWFMTQVYHETPTSPAADSRVTLGGEAGYQEPCYNPEKVKWLGPIDSIQLIPHAPYSGNVYPQDGMHEFINYKAQYDIGESLTVRSLIANFPKQVEKTVKKRNLLGIQKEQKTIVTDHEKGPVLMGHMFRGDRFKDKEATTLLYQASGNDYYTNAVTSLHFKRLSREPSKYAAKRDQDHWIERTQANPDNDTANLLSDLENVITKREQHPPVGRSGNQLSISITIPTSMAEKLTRYFQKHPEHMRAFFVEGAANAGVMTMHNPPPYAKWDTEKPNRKILLRKIENPDEGSDTYLA